MVSEKVESKYILEIIQIILNFEAKLGIPVTSLDELNKLSYVELLNKYEYILIKYRENIKSRL